MIGAAVREVLVRGEIVAPEPLAPGFPLWMPHGTRLMERLEDIVLEALRALGDVEELDVELLFAADEYVRQASESLEYQNMYALEGDQILGDRAGGPLLLRPDNVVAAATRLAARAGGTVFCRGSLWRADTQRSVPLIRDRHLWRALEAVTLLPEGRNHALHIDDALSGYWEILDKVSTALALPQIYYTCPGLRDHSSRCLLTLATPTSEELTLTSTLFELSPAMSGRLGVSGTLIDLGLTAKLLALSLFSLSDPWGLVTPSEIAPDQIVVGAHGSDDAAGAQRLAGQLRLAGLRAAADTDVWQRVLRKCRRRGVPLLILVDGAGASKLIHRVDHESRPLADDPLPQILDALAAHDRHLAARGQEALRTALDAAQAVRLLERGQQVPPGWYPLGSLCSIGASPGSVHSPDDAPVVLARSRRLY